MELFKYMGMWAYPLAVIAVAVLVLIVRTALRLPGMTADNRIAVGNGLHGILFWGSVSALLGIIGQNSGIYNALTVISQATEISPQAVATGVAQSLTTTLFGLTTLLVAAVAWFTLLTRYRRAAR